MNKTLIALTLIFVSIGAFANGTGAVTYTEALNPLSDTKCIHGTVINWYGEESCAKYVVQKAPLQILSVYFSDKAPRLVLAKAKSNKP